MKRIFCLLWAFCLAVLPFSACLAEAPAALYFNPDGGGYYHADANCPSVKADYLPLRAFDSALLSSAPYGELAPCPICLSSPTASENEMSEVATQEAASAFAERFFTSPHVGEAIGGLTVTATDDGWQAEATAGASTLTLLFDQSGRVALYQNSAYPLPEIVNEMPTVLGLDDTVYDGETLNAMDALFRALVNQSFDSVCCWNVDETTNVYAYRYNFMEAFALFALEPKPRLLGYGDMRLNACRYEGYLSRGEAIAKGRAALEKDFQLSVETMHTLIVTQTAFRPFGYPLENEERYPTYWDVCFSRGPQDASGSYEALIDAITGETLETRDPSMTGNG